MHYFYIYIYEIKHFKKMKSIIYWLNNMINCDSIADKFSFLYMWVYYLAYCKMFVGIFRGSATH